MRKKLPKTIAARWEEDGGTMWLSAEVDADGHAEMNWPRKVGIYTLTEVVEVKGVASITSPKGGK